MLRYNSIIILILSSLALAGSKQALAESIFTCDESCQARLCTKTDLAHICYRHCKNVIGETCMKKYALTSLEVPHKLNTSNPGKLAEFQRLFAKYNHDMTNTKDDLDEVLSDPLTVIAQKASAVNQGKGQVLVEDTSLDIEGEDVGVNIRWLLSNLDKYEGKQASWTVLLAFREKDVIFVSKGEVKGKIVQKRGDEGFGFDPYFLPEGAEKTLAQDKPDTVNARALAVDAMMNHEYEAITDAIDEWDGPWQEGDH